MSDLNSKREEYMKDPRIACKYGSKCYQKNPLHQNKYKHPPKSSESSNTSKRNIEKTEENEAKKAKINPDLQLDLEINKIEINQNNTDRVEPNKKEISDSEEESDKNDEITTLFDAKIFIKNKFLMDMPQDFYDFWNFCTNLNPKNPSEAFKNVNLKLVGPFDVLANKFQNAKIKNDENYLIHWRYYYDIPEFQTVLKGNDQSGYHIGYFRDSPEDLPVFMAFNHANKNGIFSTIGENIFAAVYLYLEEIKKSGDPFKKMFIGKFQSSIKNEAEKLELSLAERTEGMKKRQTKTVTRSLNNIGLVVPYNKKTQLGYRELAVSDKNLKTLLDKLQSANPDEKSKYLSDLQPVLTYASIALDECDFGTGIELGWDIIAHGIDSLNNTALRFLSMSYNLLNRAHFAKIAEAHLNNRKKGCDLSIL